MESLVTANAQQRRVRALLSAAGVALGVCLVMLFTGLARGLSNDLERRSQNLKAELIFSRSGGMDVSLSANASVSVRYKEELEKIDGVAMAVPDIRWVSEGSKGFGFEQIEGVDWDEFARMRSEERRVGKECRSRWWP